MNSRSHIAEIIYFLTGGANYAIGIPSEMLVGKSILFDLLWDVCFASRCWFLKFDLMI